MANDKVISSHSLAPRRNSVVSKAIQDVALNEQASSENADSVVDIVDESTNAAKQVAETSQNQAEMAQVLNELFHRFKIS